MKLRRGHKTGKGQSHSKWNESNQLDVVTHKLWENYRTQLYTLITI